MAAGRRRTIASLVLVLSVAVAALAQRRFGNRLPPNPDYDGAFIFCRIMFRQNPYGDGGGWGVDYPRADINFPYRLSELTTTWAARAPKPDVTVQMCRS